MRPRAYASVVCALAACGGQTGQASDAGHDAGTDRAADRSVTIPEASADASLDVACEVSGPPDGPPSYTSACTPLASETGTAIDTMHGRLDGYLAFVVPIGGSHACNGDDSHLHLQIRAGTDIYDVAVDTGKFTGDVSLYEADMPIPDGAWAEGWHGADDLTYTSLGIHSTEFAPEDPTTLGAKLQAELAGVNHIAVFGTGYAQGNGCHDVHYESGNGHDGAIVLEPLSTSPHMLFFRFSTDTF
jgi:hypothetical protein